MNAILTVTLNPALDVSTTVQEVIAGPKLRCRQPVIDPGGGGVNVSRVIARMGGHSTAFVVLGGANGAALADLLAREGVQADVFKISDQTRQCVSVIEDGTGKQFRFVLPGPRITAAEFHQLTERLSTSVPKDGLVVISGSIPEGVPDTVVHTVCEISKERGAKLIVDTAGDIADRLVGHPCGIHVLRLDQVEADDLAGRRLLTRQDAAEFARSLIERSVAEIVVFGRGAEGSLLASADHCYFCRAAEVEVLSKTGAGDSFVAAFTHSLAQRDGLEKALHWGVAAASAAVMTEATRLCELDTVTGLLDACPIETLPL